MPVPMRRARTRTGTATAVSLGFIITVGVLISCCGGVYLPEDGPPLPLVNGALTPGAGAAVADDGVLTVIPGKAKPPPSERVPPIPVATAQRPDGCIDAVLAKARAKRSTRVHVTETDDAIITEVVRPKPKPAPVRQVVRQRMTIPARRYVCPEQWKGLDLSDPAVLECPENATGFFPFPPDCRKYLNCWRGRGTIQPCSPATFFDPVRRECDYPEKVKCLPDCYAPATGSGSSGGSVDSGSGPGAGQVFVVAPIEDLINAVEGNDFGQGNNDFGQGNTGNEGFGARDPDPSPNPSPSRPGYIDLSQNNQQPGPTVAPTDDYGLDPAVYLRPENPSGHSPLLDVRDLPTGTGRVARVRPSDAKKQTRTDTAPASGGEPRSRSRSRRYAYTSTPSKYCQMEGGTGLAPDPEHCGRFYNCAHGQGYLTDCAPGTLFSEHMRNCDHSHLVNCGSRPRHGHQRPPTPYEPVDPYSGDSRGDGSIRHEVQVPYRPAQPAYQSEKSFRNYQPTGRNPDADYRPAYPVVSQTPKPVFFQPHMHPQNPNYRRPNQGPYNQDPHHHHHSPDSDTDASTIHHHPTASGRFIHNHPPNSPFVHNHPTNMPFVHNHPPNEPFRHNHPPYSPYNRNNFHHNHPPHPQNPTYKPHDNPAFNTALNPTGTYNPQRGSPGTYNPQRGSPSPTPARPQDPVPPSEEDDDQAPQGSSPVGDLRPNQNSFNNPPQKGYGNQGPKSPENHPSLYPVRGQPAKPQGREDRWSAVTPSKTTAPPETAETTTPCPTADDPIEGEADKDVWVNLVNKTRSARTPMPGQWVRLRDGASTLEGRVEILGPGAVWGGVCDSAGAWNIEKASIVCKQLGFERGAEAAWQGQGGGASTKAMQMHVDSVTCGEGAPSLLHCALQRGWNEYACDASTRAAHVRCLPNWASKCQPGETLRGDRCYRLFQPTEAMEDLAHSASEAVEHCRERGGHIVDVNSQAENDFLTDWLASEHPDVDAILTSGLGVRVKEAAERDLWIWQTDSYSPMGYTKWWPGWTNRGASPPDIGDRTLCVLLKKSFPCDGRRFGESCPAEYMYWHAVDCAQRGQLYPYVCERKGDDIGCVDGTAEEYKGKANVTGSGRACLPWDDPRVVSGLKYRVSEQTRRDSLSGHNYCRKVTGNREPWCYVDYGHNMEIRAEDCQIPPCWDRGTGTDNDTDDADAGSDASGPGPGPGQPSNDPNDPGSGIPWQYAPNFPHMVFAARAYRDRPRDDENSVEVDQGEAAAASDAVTTEVPYESVDPNSIREDAGREGKSGRGLDSSTLKPGLFDPIVGPKPKPTWSRPSKTRPDRFTTTAAPTDEPGQETVTVTPETDTVGPRPKPKPTWSRPPKARPNRFTTTPAPTDEPDQETVTVTPETDGQFASTTVRPGPIGQPSRPPWMKPRPNRPGRSTTTPTPEQPDQEQPDQEKPDQGVVNPVFDEIFTSASPDQALDERGTSDSGIQTVGVQPSRTLQAPHITQNPQYPKVRQYPNRNPESVNPEDSPNGALPEIPLDVDDPIPDTLVNNPVMPPSYPDGRPPIPSDEKPPIVSRGSFPGKANDLAPEEIPPENELPPEMPGETPFLELLRILHERYGKPNPPPPRSFNGHTGPMGWYSPQMMGSRTARSSPPTATGTGTVVTVDDVPFSRVIANETENIMKIPRRKSTEKKTDEPTSTPLYYM